MPFCTQCGKLISHKDMLQNEGICNGCVQKENPIDFKTRRLKKVKVSVLLLKILPFCISFLVISLFTGIFYPWPCDKICIPEIDCCGNYALRSKFIIIMVILILTSSLFYIVGMNTAKKQSENVIIPQQMNQ